MATLKNLLIGIVLFSLICTGFWMFFTEGAVENDVAVEAEYAEIFGTMNETLEEMGNASYEYMDQSQYGGQTFDLTFSLIFKGFGNALLLIFVAPTLLSKMVVTVAAMMGVPGWLVGAGISIVFIIVMVVLIGLILRIKGGV